jgi:hypothetical protein
VSDKKDPAFANEMRILQLLSGLQHSNIVPLLASYTTEQLDEQRKFTYTHNMLFPWADGGSLSGLLWNENMPVIELFSSIDKLTILLHGLSSAIESLHDYISPHQDNLQLIGCHMDLKPANILIHQGKLLLADFGLSRLSPDKSRTRFQNGQGDYLAPECEIINGGTIHEGQIGRGSDIWALGCIILDILIRRDGGPRALQDFRKSRKQQVIPGLTASPYHAFNDTKPLPAVTEALKSLRSRCCNIGAPLVDLVDDLLQLKIDDRLKASRVTKILFLLSQRMVLEQMDGSLQKLQGRLNSVHWEMERQRLQLWRQSANLTVIDRIKRKQDGSSESWLVNDPHKFDAIKDALQKMKSEFHTMVQHPVLVSEEYKLDGALFRIRRLNDYLWTLLERPELTRLTSALESHMVGYQSPEQPSLDTHLLVAQPPIYNRLSAIYILRHMLKRIDDNANRVLSRRMFTKNVIRTTEKGPHKFGKREGGEDVLVEYVKYDINYYHKGDKEANEIFDRVEKLANLLASEILATSFRSLSCIEYFHDVGLFSFGLVFRFPKAASHPNTPWTLKTLIKDYPRRPVLGDLFELSRKIVNSVLSLHKMENWLHKNISAHNILFFLPLERSKLNRDFTSQATKALQSPERSPSPAPSSTPVKTRSSFLYRFNNGFKSRSQPTLASQPSHSSSSSSIHFHPGPLPTTDRRTPSPSPIRPQMAHPRPLPASALSDPFLVGFNYSREDSSSALTSGGTRNVGQALYYHPSYAQHLELRRFRAEYDYFSVGLVLLEIGLWETLEEMHDDQGRVVEVAGQKRTGKLIEEFIPRLGSTMGGIYRDAVAACLDGSLGSEVEKEPLWNLFEQHVAIPLQQCRV